MTLRLRNRTLAVLALMLVPVAASAQLLGRISFPNSGVEAAQADFLEGVLYLHNFEYEDAARAFRRAQDIDSGFALAYWGEAMTHNHPLWNQQDREAARSVLGRLAPSARERQDKAGTDRERAYLSAVELLFGTDDASESLGKLERDELYRHAMRRLAEAYPEDHEATSFYALSILGTAHEGRDFATYMRAAAVAQQVWDVNREHPGAAHYLIHSFDDPVHAPLGLPMARAYSKIAPAAAHAQHMTSHIFVALGMWDEVVAANEVARKVQTERQAELGERLTVCGHYPYWLLYGYLQQGRAKDAGVVLETCEARVEEEPTEGELWHFRAMRARYAIDLEDWSSLERWTDPDGQDLPGAGEELVLFARAYAAWRAGDVGHVRKVRASLNELEAAPWPQEADELLAITRLELDALLDLMSDRPDRSLDLLRKAAAAEHALPYAFGPPQLAKPASELLGEVLASRGQWSEARQAYVSQLERTPQRSTSLSGLLVATRALGDLSASEELARRLDENLRFADPEADSEAVDAGRGE